MRHAPFLVAALLLIASTSCKDCPDPLVIHVWRDVSASFAKNLRAADLEFAASKPHVRSGKGLIVATNEGTSFQFLLTRFKQSTPDLVIFESQASIPFDPGIRNQLVNPESVCGKHPAFIPTSASGDEREGAQMYLRFLISRCMANVDQLSVPSMAISATQSNPETDSTEEDPHRHPCSSARCRKIKAFLKTHYCGESPFGNGPDDGCDLRVPKKPVSGTLLTADYECHWSETDSKTKCEQKSQASPEIRQIIVRELRRMGLPRGGEKELYFKVLKSKSSGWTLAAANYWHLAGLDLTSCQLVLLIDQSQSPVALRKVPVNTANVDTPNGTTWEPIDIADVDGDGNFDVVLQGDAYEDHWLEVVNVGHGSPRTIFSGLGYYL